MYILESKDYKVEIENGVIKGFYYKNDKANLADYKGKLASVCYTLMDDKIDDKDNYVTFGPYISRTSIGSVISKENNTIKLLDSDNCIKTKISLQDGLLIEASTNNKNISEFGINLDMNFVLKDGEFYSQLLPTSPYSSKDGKFQYCIFTRPDKKWAVAVALNAVGWKIDYSSENYGHFILNFKYFNSFDKIFSKNNNIKKELSVHIHMADSLDAIYDIIHKIYNVPYCRLIVGGGFNQNAVVFLSPDTNRLEIISPSGIQNVIKTSDFCEIPLEEYGFYTLIPYNNDIRGMEAIVWNGGNMLQLFNESTKAIKKPYHPDDNLCEGGCFLWDMLANMRITKSTLFDDIVNPELDIIMDRSDVKLPRKTIVTSKTDKYAPYHIMNSNRIQEQFFGVSILLEAYKNYKNEEYLDFAFNTLSELLDNWITDNGMITNGHDYTTVCAPIIPIVDMYNVLSHQNDNRAERFFKLGIKIADYLVNRGFDFPTEGVEKFEDGSISCTALSVLYVCKNMYYDKKYINFAKKILDFHNAWCIYSPDVKMNQSSFRWWETIWEGDGQGPAICAGHAWTIWRTEALYLYGILTLNQQALLDSWNGFLTNFCKTEENGTMFSCYEPDFIRGGGIDIEKTTLKQLKGEDISVKYEIAHGYPKHADNSLSRYAWIRNAYTWLNTAAILKCDNIVVALNGKKTDESIILEKTIQQVYINENINEVTLICDNPITVLCSKHYSILQGEIFNNEIIPQKGKIKLRLNKQVR